MYQLGRCSDRCQSFASGQSIYKTLDHYCQTNRSSGWAATATTTISWPCNWHEPPLARGVVFIKYKANDPDKSGLVVAGKLASGLSLANQLVQTFGAVSEYSKTTACGRQLQEYCLALLFESLCSKSAG